MDTLSSAHICLLGDFSDQVGAHKAINQSLCIASSKYQGRLTYQWVKTSDISDDIASQFSMYDAIWCVPGSPYENMSGVLNVLNYARTHKVPFLGTCGGYQHALIEYARNVLSILDADHAEINPESEI
ncbi:glutamine amidotransferase-related protein [Acinetobacter rathckeae]|uniref:glutamine amidotransferase-related protein n=1 Tax=Acinetobacter rathckeae TaxID=2605272 RepID=UPI0018A2B95F|nr:hypothetical protein [Acinetobacter rathckeae]MBF7688642.1 hypothetical protein [Acinetobacter rathckeae]MBF7695888.1 hypothetical protein [Acinetobacter rathckeae]